MWYIDNKQQYAKPVPSKDFFGGRIQNQSTHSWTLGAKKKFLNGKRSMTALKFGEPKDVTEHCNTHYEQTIRNANVFLLGIFCSALQRYSNILISSLKV